MTFWGAEVTAGKPFPYVPLPEAGQLRITQATLGLNASQGERAVLSCKVGKEETLICSLREGLNESTNLDIVLDQYAELTVQSAKKGGKASIHIVGYHILDEDPNEGDEEEGGMMLGEDEDEDEDVDGAEELMNSLPAETLKKLLQLRAARMGSDSDSEGSEDDEEMEEDSDEYDSEDLAIERKPSVIIEEITEEDEPEAAAQGGAATQQTTSATVVKTDKKGKPIEAAQVTQTTTSVPQVQLADEEDPSDEEDNDDTALDEAEESDEEPEEDPKLGKRKAASAKLEAKSGKAAKKEAVKAAQTPAAKKGKAEAVVTPAVPASADKPLKGIKKFENGFIVENVSMGDPAGKLAKGGKKVVVKYVGKLAKTGKIFDQTKGNKTFSFRLGVGEVIKGWDQGVVGMRVGDKRKLTVPPQMAYGPKGIPNAIPGNSTLLFDVELIDVKG